MASLVLGVAGAAIGSFFGPWGAMIGWTLGSALGNLIDPKKTQGPRLDNLHLSGSSFGTMIPIVFGTVRTGGNCIYQEDLKPQEHHSSGKGGGGGSTTTTYNATFAFQWCEGPKAGLMRMWASGRLVYDVTPGHTEIPYPFTLYLGTETQGPDPTMEAGIGAGNVPGYRGTVYTVFDNIDVTDYGNSIPALSAEIVSSVGTFPTRVSTWTPPFGTDALPRNAWRGVSYADGVITITTYNNGVTHSMSGGPIPYRTQTFTIDGTAIDDTTITAFTLGGGAGNMLQASNSSHIAVAQQNGVGTGTGSSAYYLDGGPTAGPITPPIGFDDYYAINERGVWVNDFLFATGGNPTTAWIARFPAVGGDPSPAPDASYVFSGSLAGSSFRTVEDSGNIYVISINERRLYTFDQELNLITATAVNTLPTDCTDAARNFMVHNGILLYSRVASGTTPDQAVALTINGAGTFTEVGAIPAALGDIYPLTNCLALCRDGVISICGTPGAVSLASICTALSLRAGLNVGQIDVSDIEDILVDGYLITQQGDLRSMLEPLLQAYFVAAVESDNTIKFVKLGKPSIVTIPDGDLAAYSSGVDPPALLTFTRTQEVDLPRTVYLAYMNKDADYQVGSQHASRQATSSQSDITLNFPIVFTDAEAKNRCSVILYRAWLERDRYKFFTTRKYAHYEPTDVVTVQGIDLRIITKTEQAGGVIQFEAVPSSSALYVQNGIGAASSGFTQTVAGARQLTNALLLDIPLIDDADDPNGFYVAAAGATNPVWRGYSLFRSTDGGTTYSSVFSSTTRSVMGTALTVLPDFDPVNVFDEASSVDVLIGIGGGTISSSNADAVLNGANTWLLGNEIFQSKNAPLVAPNTYRLTGHLRGRRGTEWAMGTHAVGERFVALPVPRVPSASSLLYQTVLYKAVTNGNTQASARVLQFANTGNSLKPYSPVQVGGGSDSAGNVTINWHRRTRIGGTWSPYVDVPLSETTEAYIVQICDASYTIFGEVVTGITSPTYIYSVARQTTVFGRRQETLFGTVGQVGSFALGSQTRFAIPAGGAGNDLPIISVPPYVAPPLIPPVPPTAGPVDGTLIWPSDSKVIPMTIGQRKVYSFTTGGTIPNTGTIAVSEYGTNSRPTPRHSYISTDSSGVNKVAHSESYNGTTATSYIGAGTGGAILAAATTYYFVFDFMYPDGTLSGPPGADGQTILNLGNVT